MFIRKKGESIFIPDQFIEDFEEITLSLDGLYLVGNTVVNQITVAIPKVQTETEGRVWVEDPCVILKHLKNKLKRVQIDSKVIDAIKHLEARKTETKEEMQERLMKELQDLG
jgi:hypothetical protein